VNPRGAVVQLFPNSEDTDFHFRKGVARYLPPDNAEYEFPATDVSTAVEHLLVVASTRRWDPLAGEKDGSFTVFPKLAGRRKIREHIGQIRGGRGFGVKPTDLVAEYGLKYLILPAR